MTRRALVPPQHLGGTIRKFEPAYWYINFPLPVTGAIVTTGPNSLRITGSLYTNKDNISQIWESKDTKDHPLFAYEFSRNYRDVILQFDYNLTGELRGIGDAEGPVLTVTDDLGENYYIRLANHTLPGSTPTQGTVRLVFNEVYAGEFEDFPVPWERVDEMFIFWTPKHYGIGAGKTTLQVDHGDTTLTTTVPNGVPIKPGDRIRLRGTVGEEGYIVTSDTSGPVQTVTFMPPVETSDGSSIPANTDVSVETNIAYPITKTDIVIELTNISVTGGNHLLGVNNQPLPAHKIRMTDGYDNAYPFTPERIVHQLWMLGYREWYNIYIGISHHHTLKYDPGEDKYLIDLDGPTVCIASQDFFQDLFSRLVALGFKNIISVSFEILDQLCPSAWAQRDHAGVQALTGWSPSSTLVSPCNTQGVDYLRDVFLGFCDILDNAGGDIYVQVGEPWWWDGSFSGGVRRPFIYDSETQADYVATTGNPVPTPFLQDVVTPIAHHGPYLDFCRQRLGEAGVYLQNEVKAVYPNAKSLILIFTPQFLGTSDPILRRLNLPIAEWSYPAFDIVQVEDYDKIVEGDYDFITDQTVRTAVDTLGYSLENTQYFVGFNLFEQTTWVWHNIDHALYHVRDVPFAEVFVWSREQVLRDGWVYNREGWKFLPDVTTLAACWRIERVDGQVLTFTTHDRPLTIDGELYSPANSYSPGDIESNADTSANQMEVYGITSEDITERDLILGKYEHAQVDIFLVDYTDLTIPRTYVQTGWMGQVTTQQDSFRAELRGMVTRLQQHIGQVYGSLCRWKFGGAECGVDVSALTVSDTVDSVPGLNAEALSRPASSGSQLEAVRQTLVNPNDEFIVFGRSEPDGYFDFGVVTWTSGDNKGLSMEVLRYEGGKFTLLERMPHQMQVGDTFDVYPGCNLIASTCKNKFSNFVNFGGFDAIPGNDDVLNYANSKSS